MSSFNTVITVYFDVNNKLLLVYVLQTSKASGAPALLDEAGSQTSSYPSSIYALLGYHDVRTIAPPN